jgi:hypothetical protein
MQEPQTSPPQPEASADRLIGEEEVVVTPEWAAYRQGLFDLVGDDDPAAVQAATPAALRARLDAAASRGVLREAPARGEWSVLELFGHALDAEIFSSARYRWVLGHDRPALEPFDQDLIAGATRHRDADPEVLLAAFEGLRAANLELWARTSDEERSREGLHAERGPSSYRVLFTEMAGHDRFHLAQIDRTLDALSP